MKRLFLVLTISLSALMSKAQSIDVIKNEFTLQQYDKAKADVDKAFANGKITGKAEAHLLKSAIYSTIAMSDVNKGTPTGDQLNNDAVVAFNKYKEMDPTMELVTDLVYQSAPINIYSSFYSSGYNDYADKKWQAGFEKLKKAVEFSDLLISKKLLTATLDTNVLILAGITAENSGNKDDAAKFYGRLADNKLSGDGFESVYRFLVGHYFAKKDMAAFEKYKATGGELYPKSEFFKFDKVDFAVGLVETFTDKLKALEEILATDPNNFKANEIMGELYYDTLNSSAEKPVLPPNAAEWEAKMVTAFNKAAAANPGLEMPYLYLGDHFINKAAKVGELRDAHAKEMKAKAKPGVKPTAEDVAKRDMLEKQYGDAMEGAREPYEKAAGILSTKSHAGESKGQEMRDKQQYKKATSYLANIFEYKRSQSKPNSPEFTKWAAEAKKWNDIYEGIK
ncbi:MAG: hypothetical protein NTW29_07495 [Bacteroidetes bacterium]|nr:hypothetical protein [Bacteroidota bacterium]